MQEMPETWVRSLTQEDPLDEEIAIHSSILAWKVPWTEETGGYTLCSWREQDTNEQLSMDANR